MIIRILYFVFIFLLILPINLYAGSFNVVPIKVFLDANNKTDNLKINNESDKKVTIQVKAYEWSQDEKGKDVYQPTTELMYFPRIFDINAKEERTIKIGYDKKPSNVEKTFRIYIEEVPQAEVTETAQLRMALKMGIPIFVTPTKTQLKGEIAKAEVSKGQVSFEVKNMGNVHFTIKNIKIQGTDSSGNAIFSENKQGWYILTGKSRTYSIDISQDKCTMLKEVNIEIDAEKGSEKFTIKDKISVDKKGCEG